MVNSFPVRSMCIPTRGDGSDRGRIVGLGRRGGQSAG